MLTSTLPSYPYIQYSDDPNIVAFFTAYNNLSNANLNQVNNLNLPIYTSQSGSMLDWVGTGIYGIERGLLPAYSSFLIGTYNSYPLNSITYNGDYVYQPTTDFIINDDMYQRIITWNFYKGDGFQFNINWLKRRVARFLNNDNYPDNTYQVSVQFTGSGTANITLTLTTVTTAAQVLQAGIKSGALQTPFQVSLTVIT